MFGRNFVNNLTKLLSKEMGLKSLIVLGLLTLGMRVMNELLILCRHNFLL
jgi:hypothetical protein